MARSVDVRMSHHDLLRLASQGVRGELLRGVLCETMPTGLEHGKVVMNLGILLGVFIKPAKLGTLAASDAGVLLERDPDTVREPDLAYFSAENCRWTCGFQATPRSSPIWWWRSYPPMTTAGRSTTRR